jgi:hypothetical protein
LKNIVLDHANAHDRESNHALSMQQIIVSWRGRNFFGRLAKRGGLMQVIQDPLKLLQLAQVIRFGFLLTLDDFRL